jgi:hypothetical protein
MNSARISALVVAGLTADIQAASAADLPLKPRYSHEQVTDQGRPRDSNSTAKEPLFQQFLEWLKKQ